MTFDKIAEFFAMGGYGFYVWFAYGVTLLLLALPLIQTCYLIRRFKKYSASL